jgi:RNA polymerase sigma-54 factor
MARQRIGLTQSQRLNLNTGLQTSIRMLRMDAGGLTRFLEEQAERNPYLSVTAPPILTDNWQPRWMTAFGAESGQAVEVASPGPSLMAHVLSQIDTVTRSARERHIAMVLAEALEPSGRLGRPLRELALQAGCAEGDAEAVLMRLQQIEPTGLFARSLSECLRLQAIDVGQFDEVMSILLDHLDMVAAGDLARLSRLCRSSEFEVLSRLKTIRGFDPKPGAQFDHGAANARETDLIATPGPGGWKLTLNRSALPTVEVLRPSVRLKVPAERSSLAAALGLRRMLERRNSTLLRVAGEIVTRQHEVLDSGLGALLPMTLADVAATLDLHESTVSRVVAGVSIATPQGTWMLKSLFGPRVGDTSAAAIRAEIARLVSAENPTHPLTDQALTIALGAAGRKVARRTVAKYREMLRIPTAGVRRRARRR